MSDPLQPHGLWPLGFFVHGILQAIILEWVTMWSYRGSSQSRIEPASSESPELAGGYFTVWAIKEAL